MESNEPFPTILAHGVLVKSQNSEFPSCKLIKNRRPSQTNYLAIAAGKEGFMPDEMKYK